MPFGWHWAHFGSPFLILVLPLNLHIQLPLVKTDQRGTSLFLYLQTSILSLESNEDTHNIFSLPSGLMSSHPSNNGEQITAFFYFIFLDKRCRGDLVIWSTGVFSYLTSVSSDSCF